MNNNAKSMFLSDLSNYFINKVNKVFLKQQKHVINQDTGLFWKQWLLDNSSVNDIVKLQPQL